MTKITTTGAKTDTSATAMSQIVNGVVSFHNDKKFILDISGDRTVTFAGSDLTYDSDGAVTGG